MIHRSVIQARIHHGSALMMGLRTTKLREVRSCEVGYAVAVKQMGKLCPDIHFVEQDIPVPTHGNNLDVR